ncbi:MAG: GNAT family N-acetyltransferase [Lachnospiraceae bacterium]|nr:GNAT family N-acetyltransferase [Lachnospiraceae bacterium]
MSNKAAMKEFICEDPKEMYDFLRTSSGLLSSDYPDLLPYPFTKEMLTLLKNSNPFKQKYYYIEQENKYAFFIVYESRMNIMTLGKSEWMMKVKTIGFPCSLSNGGYVTNDLDFLLSYCRKLKGGILILNVENPVTKKGFGFGETLPSCVLKLREEHTDIDAYLHSLRSPYRRRMNLAVNKCRQLGITVSRYCGEEKKNAPDFYSLYLNTFNKSEYKLECLEKQFFDECEGCAQVFEKDGNPVGFTLLYEDGDKLIFEFCGMEYENFEDNADLYFYMLLHIVEYAIEKGLHTIDFGQTSELTKLKFGALLEKRYFYAHHTNPFLNLFAILGKGLLEYHYSFPDFNVFR